MCGIAGFVDFNKNLEEKDLRKMTKAISHRGPDGDGHLMWNTPNANVGFGHRRLAIIDLSDAGRQPKRIDGYTLTFNGEIYNYKEIKDELKLLGHSFTSASDTEVLLRAFDQWGIDAVKKCIGMFAFALHDEREGKVFLFRDRVGVKPLYIYHENDCILFASELKSFHQVSKFKKVINTKAVSLFMQYGYIPAPYSIFQSCEKLLPGHYQEIDLNEKTTITKSYWQIDDSNTVKSGKANEEELNSLLVSSFEYRTVSDVPIGIFLSGGIDSSILAGILQSNSSSKLNTYTIGFEDSKYDESGYAKDVAKYLGTKHHEHICTLDDAKKVIPSLPKIFDEPFGDSSAIPTLLVSQVASADVKVVLSSDGGDELFAGYTRYKRALSILDKIDNIPKFTHNILGSIIPSILSRDVFSNINSNSINKYLKLGNALKSATPAGVLDQIVQYLPCQLNDKILTEGNNHSVYFNAFSDKSNELNDLLKADFKYYLPDDILVKVDRATMHHSLEGRDPFLDHRLVEYAFNLPFEFKYKQNELKYLLKQEAYKYVPKELLDRPKMGFGIPVYKWLKNDLKDLVHSFVNRDKLDAHGLFQTTNVLKYRDQYLNGKSENGGWLWLLLMFQMWYDEWMV
jgi:asparagine synthase (glutamine-hydrolysing)